MNVFTEKKVFPFCRDVTYEDHNNIFAMGHVCQSHMIRSLLQFEVSHLSILSL